MSDVRGTLDERRSTYGHYEEVARLTRKMLAACESTVGWKGLEAPFQESIHMILSKLARIVNGDPYHADSWHDVAGYATLAERYAKGEREL